VTKVSESPERTNPKSRGPTCGFTNHQDREKKVIHVQRDEPGFRSTVIPRQRKNDDGRAIS